MLSQPTFVHSHPDTYTWRADRMSVRVADEHAWGGRQGENMTTVHVLFNGTTYQRQGFTPSRYNPCSATRTIVICSSSHPRRPLQPALVHQFPPISTLDTTSFRMIIIFCSCGFLLYCSQPLIQFLPESKLGFGFHANCEGSEPIESRHVSV